jgi:Fic family protein
MDVEWEPLIPHIARANRAIAEYNGTLYGVPNPRVLLAPLTTQEAVLSSRIEGTQATLGDVLRFEAGIEPEQQTTIEDIGEIINYREALDFAKEELKTRPFNLNLLLRLHEILLDSVRGRDKGRGRFRTIQNWIGAPGSIIEQAEFVPPDPLGVSDLMDNWEKYYHSEEPDALVQLAVAHAQFEIIHPFLDGNGRLGRILVPLFLYEKKILSEPMFYLSAYLESHRDEYIAALREIGAKTTSWNRWIVFFLTAITEQSISNTEKARAIMDLYLRLKKRVIDLTHSQYAIPLLDVLFKQPIFRSSELKVLPDMPSNPMIMQLLSKLESDKILSVVQKSRGSRPSVYAFGELINLCEGKRVI